MPTPTLLRRSRAAAVLPLALAAFASACGRHGGDAKPEEVDQKASATPTEQEAAAFHEPADSALTEKQVQAYLRVAMLQFDLVRKEAPALHQQVADMDRRGKEGGLLNGFTNVVQGASALAHAGDLLGGSYVRAARTLGYNPAEMEWVRERMGEVGGYMMAKPMLAAQAQAADQMKAQVDQMAAQPGLSPDQIAEMRKNAEEMRASATGATQPRHVLANAQLVHRVRPAVSDQMWGEVGMFGGASGFAALVGLSDPKDTEAQKKLNDFRSLFQATLDNRTLPGHEDKKPEGAAAEASAAPAAPVAPAAAPAQPSKTN